MSYSEQDYGEKKNIFKQESQNQRQIQKSSIFSTLDTNEKEVSKEQLQLAQYQIQHEYKNVKINSLNGDDTGCESLFSEENFQNCENSNQNLQNNCIKNFNVQNNQLKCNFYHQQKANSYNWCKNSQPNNFDSQNEEYQQISQNLMNDNNTNRDSYSDLDKQNFQSQEQRGNCLQCQGQFQNQVCLNLNVENSCSNCKSYHQFNSQYENNNEESQKNNQYLKKVKINSLNDDTGHESLFSEENFQNCENSNQNYQKFPQQNQFNQFEDENANQEQNLGSNVDNNFIKNFNVQNNQLKCNCYHQQKANSSDWCNNSQSNYFDSYNEEYQQISQNLMNDNNTNIVSYSDLLDKQNFQSQEQRGNCLQRYGQFQNQVYHQFDSQQENNNEESQKNNQYIKKVKPQRKLQEANQELNIAKNEFNLHNLNIQQNRNFNYDVNKKIFQYTLSQSNKQFQSFKSQIIENKRLNKKQAEIFQKINLIYDNIFGMEDCQDCSKQQVLLAFSLIYDFKNFKDWVGKQNIKYLFIQIEDPDVLQKFISTIKDIESDQQKQLILLERSQKLFKAWFLKFYEERFDSYLLNTYKKGKYQNRYDAELKLQISKAKNEIQNIVQNYVIK